MIRIAAAVAAVLLVSSVAGAQDAPDEFGRMVAAYELTMPRIEAYGAVMAGIADWAARNPAGIKAMLARGPKGDAPPHQAAAVFEKEPAVKALLDQHKLTGLDLVLLPSTVMQAQIAVLGEAKGRTFPADRINPKNIALAKANGAAIDALMKKAHADADRAFARAK